MNGGNDHDEAWDRVERLIEGYDECGSKSKDYRNKDNIGSKR